MKDKSKRGAYLFFFNNVVTFKKNTGDENAGKSLFFSAGSPRPARKDIAKVTVVPRYLVEKARAHPAKFARDKIPRYRR